MVDTRYCVSPNEINEVECSITYARPPTFCRMSYPYKNLSLSSFIEGF